MRGHRYFLIILVALAALPAGSGAAWAQDTTATTPTEDQAADQVPDADQQDAAAEDFDDLPEVSDDATARNERAGADEDDAEPSEDEPADRTDASEPAQADPEHLNCDDFNTQEGAQDYFTDEGGSDTNNVDGLDEDGDGVACEALSAPKGGVDAGGGGTAAPPSESASSPLPYLLGGAGAGLAFGAVALGARRRRVRG